SPDAVIADPRRRAGHRVKDGAVWFDDAADAKGESRGEAIDDNDPEADMPGEAVESSDRV
ncbi:MAG: hypothetical protein QOC95_1844, partial [Thermoleophilaceae bacterium]|nr:hypothetical protein [Thermoleophilaceae bacterium]